MSRIWKKMAEKGQDLVEYALLLAIVVGIGGFIYSQGGLSDSIKSIWGNSSNLLKVAASQTSGNYNLNDFLKYIQEFQKKYTGGMGGAQNEDWNRGMFMSTWLKDDDSTDSTIQDFLTGMGAEVWSYYNGLGVNYKNGNINKEDQGLYWSTENLDNAGLTLAEGKSYSSEKVLSYYYDGSSYYVIKNNVWMNQGHNNGIGMAAKGQEGNQDHKPPSEPVGGPYSSYSEAQKAYEQAKNANGGSYIFKKLG